MRNQSWRVLVGAVVLCVSTGSAQMPAAVPTDSARLQGTWVMASGAADGYALPPEYVQQMRRVNVGREVTITMSGSLFFKAEISLDTAQSLRTIDYHMTAGPTAGAVQRGIYAISGDTVRFCFAAPGGPRPTTFTTVATDGRTLSTWIRARSSP